MGGFHCTAFQHDSLRATQTIFLAVHGPGSRMSTRLYHVYHANRIGETLGFHPTSPPPHPGRSTVTSLVIASAKCKLLI